MSKHEKRFQRRELLKLAGLAAAAAGLPLAAFKNASAAVGAMPQRKFLFVMAAQGGASIVDGFLPQIGGPNGFSADQLEQPNGSSFRCPKVFNNSIQGQIPLGDKYAMSTFLAKYATDTVVMTNEGTSVNHYVAARRAVTGNGINAGRTIQEAAAARHGMDMLLPNCNMGGDGYGGPSIDPTVPDKLRGEVVSDARYFPLATHGYRGIKGAPGGSLVDHARAVRARLESHGKRMTALQRYPQVDRYLDNRAKLGPSMEAANLINKLLIFGTDPQGQPLSTHGLEKSPDFQQLADRLPNLQKDPFEAQTALSFMLAKHGVSSTVTLAPPGTPYFTPDRTAMTPPIAFDWSHVDHRGAQNAMWSRVLHMTDVLIEMLKKTEYSAGQSMWDHSLVYIATEFGRDKVSSGSSGHHLNNGTVMISPLLKGNRVYGGVDPSTAMTYGFDPVTGEPDKGKVMHEGDIYSAICHAMDISFKGRKDLPCMVKRA